MSPDAPLFSAPSPAPRQATGDEAAIREALLRDEAFIRQLLESATDCLAVLDLEGRLLSLSEGGRKAWEIEDLAPYLHRPWTDWWEGNGRVLASRAVAEGRGRKRWPLRRRRSHRRPDDEVVGRVRDARAGAGWSGDAAAGCRP